MSCLSICLSIRVTNLICFIFSSPPHTVFIFNTYHLSCYYHSHLLVSGRRPMSKHAAYLKRYICIINLTSHYPPTTTTSQFIFTIMRFTHLSYVMYQFFTYNIYSPPLSLSLSLSTWPRVASHRCASGFT